MTECITDGMGVGLLTCQSSHRCPAPGRQTSRASRTRCYRRLHSSCPLRPPPSRTNMEIALTHVASCAR
ncbi:hypothetical protein SORBI_3007G046950 [Sorghum bicolor]|uniref:Uncharacterized protein n=1 Tax=Sorghum bicolor TaxID=4558 RepID=A0A1Z5R916_SORBI|nr:hypothetical protein SORBI_3007G046950 [Sorghum bicolor]OQU79931.1 hypothetical protein SORBI_3007G046950 [Sorghum bicolor]OQU79932.1 hypothetical protein SORBI_3007G046950 [Sorghum bicolor]OQU79933.1 hypothetical protein SORBI_3007G046950 [Sorghum bicolor]